MSRPINTAHELAWVIFTSGPAGCNQAGWYETEADARFHLDDLEKHGLLDPGECAYVLRAHWIAEVPSSAQGCVG